MYEYPHIFRHPRNDDLFIGISKGEMVVCSRREGRLGEFDINEVDRLMAVYDHAVTRSQALADLAEFFEDVTDLSFAQGLVIAELMTTVSENIAMAMYEDNFTQTEIPEYD